MRVAEAIAANPAALEKLTAEELARIPTMLLEDDLRLFIREAWHLVEPEIPFVPGWHIDAVSDHLEAVSRGEIRKLLINIPPGHMKSLTACVFWPTWEWTTNPVLRFLFASYANELATRDSVKSRRIIESLWYRRRWGARVTLASDQNLKTRYENTATGYRISGGLGQTGERGDRLVVDDPHNIKQIESDLERKSVLEWWDQVMSQRGSDPQTVAKVIVMQRLHQADLSGHILQEGGWTHLCLPAEYERAHPFVYVNDPRKIDGELLWPARFGSKEIAELKKPLGSYGAAGQFQQRPAPAGGGIFKRDWWRFYLEQPKVDSLVASWDLAFKDLNESSYVVGMVLGKKGADVYVLDVVRDRMGFTASCAAIRALASKWPNAHAKLIENKANGPAVLDSLSHEVGGMLPIEPRGSKLARAQAVSPLVEAGNVYLPSSAPWLSDFLDEFAVFPFGANDDQVDAFSQGLDYLAAGEAAVMIAYYDRLIAREKDEQNAA
jgi:predicted phage terminase large subunit-like protein